MKNKKFETITKEEVEAGFINKEMIDFEDRYNMDAEYRKQIEKEVYSDTSVLEIFCF